MTRVAAPPDAPQALQSLRTLLTGRGQRLLAELRDLPPAEELSAATRLRRHHPAALVSAAIGQARLRQRAAAKFGADAALMYFTPDGVEQATRAPVAAWRAERFAAVGARRVADLCCGIGGDAIALARAGMDVLAVDRDPLTCAIAEANADALGLTARITVRCADVTGAEGDLASRDADALLIDPARRTARGRTFDPEAYSPPLARALALAERVPFAAVKVAPGIPHAAIPPAVAETEWVSHGGDVKEAVLWLGTGAGQEGPRRATLLPGPHTMTGTGPPAPTGPLGRYLYEPDGAVIRAHLIAELAHQLSARLPDPSIAYLTTDEPGPTPTPTPFATAYEITDALPFNVKRLRALLRERGIGTVTIKKRGTAVTPEELRSKLRLKGANSCTIILTRTAGAPKMLLAQPVRTAPRGGAPER